MVKTGRRVEVLEMLEGRVEVLEKSGGGGAHGWSSEEEIVEMNDLVAGTQ